MKIFGLLLSLVLNLIPLPLLAAPWPEHVHQALPRAKTAFVPVSFEIPVSSATIYLRRIDYWNGQVVFVGTLEGSSGSECVSRSDFVLEIDGVAFELLSRDATEPNYGVYGPGSGFFTSCVSQGDAEPLLLAFAAPVNDGDARLIVGDRTWNLPATLREYHSNSIAAMPTATATPTLTATPTATSASAATAVTTPSFYAVPKPSGARSVFIAGKVSDEGIRFTLERIDFWDQLPDGKDPSNEVFAVLTGRLESVEEGQSSSCVGARDLVLRSGVINYELDDLRSAKQFYNIDFPGFMTPQCVDRAEPTFMVFDVDLDVLPVSLILHNARLELGSSIDELSAGAAHNETAPTERPTAIRPSRSGESRVIAAPAPADLIVDMSSLIGASVSDVEEVLGPPSVVTDMPAGSLHTIDEAAVARTYNRDQFWFDAIFDQTGVMRSLQLSSGLVDEGYRLSEWPELFARLGLASDLPPPDIEADARLVWNDSDGLTVEVMQDGVVADSAIWSVLVYYEPGKPVPTRPVSPRVDRSDGSSPDEVAVLQGANLRGGPGTDHPIVGGLSSGDHVSVAATDSTGDWLALTDGSWIAAFLVEPVANLPTATASPTPRDTPTPNTDATLAVERQQFAQATLDARVQVSPDGTWCAQNNSVGVCVGDFRYATEAGYSRAADGSRFIAFAVGVKNLGSTTTHVNPNNLTVVMADGRTYAYDSATYGYWNQPLQGVNIISGATAEGGIVFLVPSDVAPQKIVYETLSWFDSDVIIDLTDPPSD